MNRSISGRVLHLRALNQIVRDHPFTYIGSRILAESLDRRLIDNWTENYLARKSSTGRRQVYGRHWLFKSLDSNGKAEYRTCLAGSPTTHLMETWLLSRLSQDDEFRSHPSVYSYRWSEPTSGYIYRYFVRGYKQREADIATALGQSEDTCVLVVDFQAFYPTIDVTKLIERFKGRLKKSLLSAREQEAAIRCAEDLTSVPAVNGLPIGPPLSHFLANVFLAEVDEKLSERYGNRYFRYVDDIALVVAPSDLPAARKYLEDLADSEGLKIHPGKEEVIPAKSWIESVEARNVDGPDPFTRLANDLRIYLALRPNEYDDVKGLFHQSQVYLPFNKLCSTASYNRFHLFLRRMMPKLRGLSNPSEMLGRATTLRSHFWSRLQQYSSERLPANGMARRWAIQGYRFTINRLLYLAREQDRANLLNLIPDCEELATTRAILSALSTGDASDLLKFSGPSISAFCQVWLESKEGLPKVTWSSDPKMQEWDSAAVLALYGLGVPPDEWITKLPEGTGQLMVRLAAGNKPNCRSFDDFSYSDEMESLWLTPRFDAVYYLSTRFDNGERVFLPALDIGGDSYMT
jgi:hypothetical protein